MNHSAAFRRHALSAPRHAQNPLIRLAMRFDDGELVRWALRGLIAGALVVIGLDVKDIIDERAAVASATYSAVPVYAEPVSLARTEQSVEPRFAPREAVTGEAARNRSKLAFELVPGGILTVSGMIDHGAAKRFADELALRGEYVKTLRIDSTGGSLDDAMAMARMVREHALATEVTDGAICASSCPLLLAGGVSRSVAPGAAIGVHQFYALSDGATRPAQAMSDAQATTARISRHLGEMGIDPALWLHALDTPPQALYRLTVEEMRTYRLTTTSDQVAARR